jgi:hypothetical protein
VMSARLDRCRRGGYDFLGLEIRRHTLAIRAACFDAWSYQLSDLARIALRSLLPFIGTSSLISMPVCDRWSRTSQPNRLD